MIPANKWFLSTIDPQAGSVAARYGLGLEIAEFCTAFNIDDRFVQTDTAVRASLAGAGRCTLHGAFNELHPCAVDPKARELASFRFSQALELAQRYGAEKLILHGGYLPRVYFPSWYVEQSVLFWNGFLESHPGDYRICLENVLEEEPDWLAQIAEAVDDPRLGLCLDIGHANVYSPHPVPEWAERWGSRLYHAHIHNNAGSWDTHSGLAEGSMDIPTILETIHAANPDVTYTLELPQIDRSVDWLIEKELLSSCKTN